MTTVRRALPKDIDKINDLLIQVCRVHHQGRPDLFKEGAKKYTNEELLKIIENPQTPILVATDDNDTVLGYAFCMFIKHINNNILTDIKTLYIDDLCIDQNVRGKHLGTTLYQAVLDLAKAESCYNVTLNVWSLNEGAMKFYEAMGLKPQKVGMEVIL